MKGHQPRPWVVVGGWGGEAGLQEERCTPHAIPVGKLWGPCCSHVLSMAGQPCPGMGPQPSPPLAAPMLNVPCSQIKALFDATGGLWASGALVGKPVAAFTSGAALNGRPRRGGLRVRMRRMGVP